MFVFINLLKNLILKKSNEKYINGLYHILLENKDIIKIMKMMIKNCYCYFGVFNKTIINLIK